MKKQPIVEGKEFRNWVRSTRGLVGLSMQELADRLGCSLGTVKNWELGVTIPPKRAEVIVFEDLIERISVVATEKRIENNERNSGR